MARALALLVYRLVDLLHEPNEHASVHALHERVPHVHRRVGAHRCGNALAPCEDRPCGKRVGKAIDFHLNGDIYSRNQCRVNFVFLLHIAVQSHPCFELHSQLHFMYAL